MDPTDLHVRVLTADDLPAAWELGRTAFGQPPAAPPPHLVAEKPLLTRYGAFDSHGRLVGKANDIHHEQWWAGRRLAAADVAGVAVLPEARGRGVARTLLTALLRGARERGASVSALYPTVAGAYRPLGWEVCGSLRTVDLPTAAIGRQRPADGFVVRPGGRDDMPAVHDLYEQVARDRCGLLTRRGGYFEERAETGLPDGVDGLTVVERDGRLVGYALWERGGGYYRDGLLHVVDAQAVTGEAAVELLGVLGSWASVAPTVRLRPAVVDAISVRLPLELAREHKQQTWMHRPVDVVRAVRERGWPAYAHGRVDFTLTDPVAPWNTGGWRLEVADGKATLTRLAEEPALRLSVRGFALLFTGAADATTVAMAGLLTVSAGADPTALDLLAAGPRAELLDYF